MFTISALRNWSNGCRFVQKRFQHSWIKPGGIESKIKVYNCMTKSKEPFITKNKNILKMYTCGPTVYDSAHVGHASCYVKIDIIQRILRSYFDYNIISVMNITDIDDKIIRQAQVLKKPPEIIAKHYETEFWEELEALNVSKPNLILRVTENMEVIKNYIRNLVDNGYAYKASNHSVYFNTKKLINYGKLQNISKPTEENSTPKLSATDFVLWKAMKPGEPFWESEWGPGRPGWHTECAALAGAIFGSEVDLHAGGIDLQFPHHENEEAQSCGYFSVKQWVNYWLHTGHVHVDDTVKMSKSLKNTVSIQELLNESTPEVFRFACLMSHYRSNMQYSLNLLNTAENVLNKYKFLISDCDAYLKGKLKGCLNADIMSGALIETVNSINNSLIDDFNTASAITALNKLASVTHSMLHSTTPSFSTGISDSFYLLGVVNLFDATLSNFGVNLRGRLRSEQSDATHIINILNDFRQCVRNLGIENKDQSLLKLCDNVRASLQNCGITINDYGKQSIWVK